MDPKLLLKALKTLEALADSSPAVTDRAEFLWGGAARRVAPALDTATLANFAPRAEQKLAEALALLIIEQRGGTWAVSDRLSLPHP